MIFYQNHHHRYHQALIITLHYNCIIDSMAIAFGPLATIALVGKTFDTLAIITLLRVALDIF